MSFEFSFSTSESLLVGPGLQINAEFLELDIFLIFMVIKCNV